MSMIEALRLIAAVSRKHALDATKAIRIKAEPQRQVKYNDIAESVLSDPEIELSTDERRLIASFITEEEESLDRKYTLRVRLTEEENEIIKGMASDADLSISETVRGILLGFHSRIEKDLNIRDFIDAPSCYYITYGR